MRRSRIALIAAVITVISGLALGAGKSEADTSIANTASKVLLTIGAVSLFAAAAVIIIGNLRARRGGTSSSRSCAMTPEWYAVRAS